jgi:ActR/RegA family two-component response regulator/AraC-like DNA-binding protein
MNPTPVSGAPQLDPADEAFVTSLYDSVEHNWPLNHETQREGGSGANEPTQPVLWIDDEIWPGDPVLRLLALDGFDVDCAQTGSEGLRKARREPHAGISLDLRLPDMPGLAVLQHLTAAGVEAPVIVLTGFADPDSAVAAMKLGAADYKSKPQMADDLANALRALVLTDPPKIVLDGEHPRHQRIELVPALDEIARTLATPTLGLLQFVLLARSFRRLVGASDGRRQTGATPACCIAQETALATGVLGHVAQALSAGILPSLESVAQETSLTAEDINHLLKTLTSADFRECRRALRVRPTVSEVAFSHEQMAQIAYRHGYQWPGQFDRDFKTTLLVTPKAFRVLSLVLPYR